MSLSLQGLTSNAIIVEPDGTVTDSFLRSCRQDREEGSRPFNNPNNNDGDNGDHQHEEDLEGSDFLHSINNVHAPQSRTANHLPLPVPPPSRSAMKGTSSLRWSVDSFSSQNNNTSSKSNRRKDLGIAVSAIGGAMMASGVLFNTSEEDTAVREEYAESNYYEVENDDHVNSNVNVRESFNRNNSLILNPHQNKLTASKAKSLSSFKTGSGRNSHNSSNVSNKGGELNTLTLRVEGQRHTIRNLESEISLLKKELESKRVEENQAIRRRQKIRSKKQQIATTKRLAGGTSIYANARDSRGVSPSPPRRTRGEMGFAGGEVGDRTVDSSAANSTMTTSKALSHLLQTNKKTQVPIIKINYLSLRSAKVDEEKSRDYAEFKAAPERQQN